MANEQLKLDRASVRVSSREHKQLDGDGNAKGTRYTLVIETAGHVFSTVSFFAPITNINEKSH